MKDWEIFIIVHLVTTSAYLTYRFWKWLISEIDQLRKGGRK